MWIEILTMEEALQRAPVNLKPPPPVPLTLRVVIWEIKDILTEKQYSDLFVTCGLDGSPLQLTDVHRHANSLTNPPVYNWRCIFHINCDATNITANPRLLLSVFDKVAIKHMQTHANIHTYTSFSRLCIYEG